MVSFNPDMSQLNSFEWPVRTCLNLFYPGRSGSFDAKAQVVPVIPFEAKTRVEANTRPTVLAKLSAFNGEGDAALQRLLRLVPSGGACDSKCQEAYREGVALAWFGFKEPDVVGDAGAAKIEADSEIPSRYLEAVLKDASFKKPEDILPLVPVIWAQLGCAVSPQDVSRLLIALDAVLDGNTRFARHNAHVPRMLGDFLAASGARSAAELSGFVTRNLPTLLRSGFAEAYAAGRHVLRPGLDLKKTAGTGAFPAAFADWINAAAEDAALASDFFEATARFLNILRNREQRGGLGNDRTATAIVHALSAKARYQLLAEGVTLYPSTAIKLIAAEGDSLKPGNLHAWLMAMDPNGDAHFDVLLTLNAYGAVDLANLTGTGLSYGADYYLGRGIAFFRSHSASSFQASRLLDPLFARVIPRALPAERTTLAWGLYEIAAATGGYAPPMQHSAAYLLKKHFGDSSAPIPELVPALAALPPLSPAEVPLAALLAGGLTVRQDFRLRDPQADGNWLLRTMRFYTAQEVWPAHILKGLSPAQVAWLKGWKVDHRTASGGYVLTRNLNGRPVRMELHNLESGRPPEIQDPDFAVARTHAGGAEEETLQQGLLRYSGTCFGADSLLVKQFYSGEESVFWGASFALGSGLGNMLAVGLTLSQTEEAVRNGRKTVALEPIAHILERYDFALPSNTVIRTAQYAATLERLKASLKSHQRVLPVVDSETRVTGFALSPRRPLSAPGFRAEGITPLFLRMAVDPEFAYAVAGDIGSTDPDDPRSNRDAYQTLLTAARDEVLLAFRNALFHATSPDRGDATIDYVATAFAKFAFLRPDLQLDAEDAMSGLWSEEERDRFCLFCASALGGMAASGLASGDIDAQVFIARFGQALRVSQDIKAEYNRRNVPAAIAAEAIVKSGLSNPEQAVALTMDSVRRALPPELDADLRDEIAGRLRQSALANRDYLAGLVHDYRFE